MERTKASLKQRLIEAWLPVEALGEESVRERRSMTALPPVYYLHVWWARRPLVASRAAVLASLLPADVDREKFTRLLGILGDPVATRKRIDQAARRGEKAEGYGYDRAFTHPATSDDLDWLHYEQRRLGLSLPVVLDPTAGGGSIPFEAVRLGCNTVGNDLNPVAWLISRATVEWPVHHGIALVEEFKKIAGRFLLRIGERLRPYYPGDPSLDCHVTTYLWARTITCPYCGGIIPLSPNWNLSSDGHGVRLRPSVADPRVCTFETVSSIREHSLGTVKDGDALCPYPDCGRVVDGDEVKAQAQAGQMGHQIYTVVYKRRVVTGRTKAGKERGKWERGFRAPLPTDNVEALVAAALAAKLPEWEARDVVPYEAIPEGNKTSEPLRYGAVVWRDMFSPRQQLCHGMAVEVYQDLLSEEQAKGQLPPVTEAAFAYLALALDKLVNYNSIAVRWHSKREVVAGTFDRHDFAFLWSYAEMAPLVTGLGYDWAVEQTAKCIQELVELLRPDISVSIPANQLQLVAATFLPPKLALMCASADELTDVATHSVDAVVMDPPYYDNVMYAELSDFFYVWLKRTVGLIYPEHFSQYLTDKDREAVANPARFKGEKGARNLAGRDYEQRMAAIFAECRRVLKPDGIMTLMFTHKASGAWDALAKGLVNACFVITATWPVNTEAEGSLHIKEKAAAKSTIFLACRVRPERAADADTVYWEEIEPQVAQAVRRRVSEFAQAGISGVDLYLASFGPALQVFSEHWPTTRGRPRPKPTNLQTAQATLFDSEWNPYEVRPQDALDAARREVKRWRLEQLASAQRQFELDPLTEWYVLAWDAFRAPRFPADEARLLAVTVGLDMDREVVGKVCEKAASDVILWDSAVRARKGAAASHNERSMIDALHRVAFLARTQNAGAAITYVSQQNLAVDGGFLAALQALLEVLPVRTVSAGGKDGDPFVEGAANDFEALEKVRQLALGERVPRPRQLMLSDLEG